MYSPHDPGAPEPIERQLRWWRAGGQQSLLRIILTNILAVALLIGCLMLLLFIGILLLVHSGQRF